MLTSNGGFVNEALLKFAGLFVVFDYIYRGFIYVMEAFNGFYTGLTTGDPLGPITFTIAGFVGLLLLGVLALGDWTESKRVLAWRSVQIMGIIIVYLLMAKGLMASPIDPSWVYFLGLVILIAVLSMAWQQQPHVRLVQGSGLVILIGLAVAVLQHAHFHVTSAESRRYLIPLALVTAPVAGSLFGPWNRRNRWKYRTLGGSVAALSLILFARLVPGQLDGHHLNVVTRYLTFGSTLEHPDDLNYLNKVYPASLMSSLWFYGLIVAVALGIALLSDTHPRARRALTYSALAFFALFTAGSFLDGRTYFHAFVEIAAAAGKPVYHFALFRQATSQFPGHDRVPLWMNSELWSKPSLILITMWSSGTGMLIFLAALKGVPRTMYEAAEVDGANSFQRFWKITLPLISPAMFYNVVIGMIAALQTFENVYILQTPLTVDSLQSAAFLLYSRTFTELHIGEGAAMSWILVIIIVTLTILQFRFSRSWVHYEA
jgi:ABC-type sugar transport system permease subunit